MLGCYVDGGVDRLPKNTAEYEDDIIAIPISVSHMDYLKLFN